MSKFLESHNRKLQPILGDGNCLFRALSYLLFGSEEHHQQVRQTLVEFTVINRTVLSNYCLTSIEDHTAHMKYDTVWGTDLEIRAAAAYLRLPIYVCTQRSQNLQYYWECFQPLSNLTPLKQSYCSNILQTQAIHHLELAHRSRCHYDTIEMLNGGRPTNIPEQDSSISYVDLTI